MGKWEMHGYILNSYKKKDQCNAMQALFQNTGDHMWRSSMYSKYSLYILLNFRAHINIRRRLLTLQ